MVEHHQRLPLISVPAAANNDVLWENMGNAHVVPFRSFLFKIASACNLDCDYCYVYRGPDQSWRKKPKFMTPAVAEVTIRRIAEHVERHKLTNISLVLHGGEPLLAGLTLIERIFTEAKRNIPCEVELGMQSNLTLLNAETIDVFDSLGATIGASLDGGREANDRHRKDHSGRSSFGAVQSALNMLCSSETGRRVFSGILAVVDLQNEPLAVYEYLSGFRPRSLDFLLPDGTHERYPAGKESFENTPYADWLIRLFDYWWKQTEHQVPIRFFDDIIALVLDGESETENLGLNPVDLIVIETDGSLEAVDTLKITYERAPRLGINVLHASFDDAFSHTAVLSGMAGIHSRCRTCQQCPLLRICGGGYLPHRYSNERGFQNPSVYCHDLAKLILHIRNSVRSAVLTHDLPPTEPTT